MASEESSDVYIDVRTVALNPEGCNLISAIFLEEIAKHDGIEVVGCPWSVGASPIVGAMVSESSKRGKPLRGLIVRKERKTYGTGKIVEGEAVDGSNVVMIEDVINTGKSVLSAIEHIQKEGANVRGVFCVVDREKKKNNEETFLEKGYNFFSIFKSSDLV